MRSKYDCDNLIKMHRVKNNNMTQAQLAQATGISTNTISQVENNGGLTLLTAQRLALYFNVTIEDLFKFKEV